VNIDISWKRSIIDFDVKVLPENILSGVLEPSVSLVGARGHWPGKSRVGAAKARKCGLTVCGWLRGSGWCVLELPAVQAT